MKTIHKTPYVGPAIGEEILVKPPATRCTSQWDRGVVTGARGLRSVQINGVPRHIADVRAIPGNAQSVESSLSEDVDSEENNEDNEDERRPHRTRRLPSRYNDYVL